MKKGLKITLIILGVIISIIALDTLQARIFKNSPIISRKEKLAGNSYVDKGILMDTYYCVKEQGGVNISWHFKTSKFICPAKESKSEEFDFYLSKGEINNTIKFNDYFTYSDRKIYLASNIKEFYVVDGKTMTLKEFISSINKSLDVTIKRITDKLELTGALYDGGTTIYKSKEKDITLINCQKMGGNNNIYIGDYSLEYNDTLCD